LTHPHLVFKSLLFLSQLTNVTSEEALTPLQKE
jgi:hypothetical protein